MPTDEKQNTIEVGELDNVSYIRVKGAGNFKNSSSFKEFIHVMIDRSCTDFVIDLESCTSMDSTFMGVIAGIGVLLKDSCGKTLTLVKVNDHNENLLSTLGIDKFVSIEQKNNAQNVKLHSLDAKSVSKKKLAKNMLDAHGALMAISDENRIKFQDVFDFLQKEV